MEIGSNYDRYLLVSQGKKFIPVFLGSKLHRAPTVAGHEECAYYLAPLLNFLLIFLLVHVPRNGTHEKLAFLVVAHCDVPVEAARRLGLRVENEEHAELWVLVNNNRDQMCLSRSARTRRRGQIDPEQRSEQLDFAGFAICDVHWSITYSH